MAAICSRIADVFSFQANCCAIMALDDIARGENGGGRQPRYWRESLESV